MQSNRNRRLYDILGVAPNATQEEIDEAFVKKNHENHPLMGGDPKVYEDITKAYGTLRDPARRKKYDEDGTVWKDPNEEKMEKIKDQLLGKANKSNKGPSVIHPIKMTLEELYSGKTRRIAVNRDRLVAGKI